MYVGHRHPSAAPDRHHLSAIGTYAAPDHQAPAIGTHLPHPAASHRPSTQSHPIITCRSSARLPHPTILHRPSAYMPHPARMNRPSTQSHPIIASRPSALLPHPSTASRSGMPATDVVPAHMSAIDHSHPTPMSMDD